MFSSSCIQFDLVWVIFPLFHMFSYSCGKEYNKYAIVHTNITWNFTSQRHKISFPYRLGNMDLLACMIWSTETVSGKTRIYTYLCLIVMETACMTQTEQLTSSFLNFMQRFVIAKVINLFYYQISQTLNEMRKNIVQVTLLTTKRYFS